VTVPLEKFVCPVSHNCPQNCTCIKRPSDLSFSVSCQPGTYLHLPKLLPDPDEPPPRKGKFHLNFSASNIQTLEFRPYLHQTRRIDVSCSKLHSIPHEVWRLLSKMDHVDLSGNQLTILPTFLGSESITFRWLALHENPLRCNCEDIWIRGWLKSIGQGLFAPCCGSLVRCGYPSVLQNKSIFQLKDEDFCPENEVVHIVEVCGPNSSAIFSSAHTFFPCENFCHARLYFFLKTRLPGMHIGYFLYLSSVHHKCEHVHRVSEKNIHSYYRL